MTSCDKSQADIVAIFDSEAGDEDLRLTAGHLQDCAACRAFFLDLIALRRTLTSNGAPGLSTAAGQAVLNEVRHDRPDHGQTRPKDGTQFLQLGILTRWAAVLVIGLLAMACVALNRTAQDLRARLGAAEQQVAAIHEQTRLAESEERQQKAISALYFRMAELEERVNRSSRPERASFPAQVYDRAETQSNL